MADAGVGADAAEGAPGRGTNAVAPLEFGELVNFALFDQCADDHLSAARRERKRVIEGNTTGDPLRNCRVSPFFPTAKYVTIGRDEQDRLSSVQVRYVDAVVADALAELDAQLGKPERRTCRPKRDRPADPLFSGFGFGCMSRWELTRGMATGNHADTPRGTVSVTIYDTGGPNAPAHPMVGAWRSMDKLLEPLDPPLIGDMIEVGETQVIVDSIEITSEPKDSPVRQIAVTFHQVPNSPGTVSLSVRDSTGKTFGPASSPVSKSGTTVVKFEIPRERLDAIEEPAQLALSGADGAEAHVDFRDFEVIMEKLFRVMAENDSR